MWKLWKREITGISLSVLLGVCLLTGLLLWFQSRETPHYDTHVMADGTLYWLELTFPELPEGFSEFAQVTATVSGRQAEADGEADGLAVGTPRTYLFLTTESLGLDYSAYE